MRLQRDMMILLETGIKIIHIIPWKKKLATFYPCPEKLSTAELKRN